MPTFLVEICNGVRIETTSDPIQCCRSDAIITTIDRNQNWSTQTDHAIQMVAGYGFHCKIRNKRQSMVDLQAYLAEAPGNNRTFTNVIFVVDLMTSPLQKVIYAGLGKADQARLKVVTIPRLRADSKKMPLQTKSAVESQLSSGALEYLSKNKKTNLTSIKFVFD